MYLDEAGQPLYDPYREAWIRWASLTSVLLSLAAALATFSAASWGVQAYLNLQGQQRQWAYSVALTNKAESLLYSQNFITSLQLQEQKTPKVQKFVEERLQENKQKLAKLEEEREQLKEGTEQLTRQGERSARQAAGSARTAFLLFLATVLAAASVVGKKKLLWLASLVLTVVGVASFLGGIFLWF
jgi:DNA-binding transcriptional MerR regulator